MERALLSKYWQPILIVCLQIMDAILTLFIIKNGGGEANPLMRWFLHQGVMPFCLAKLLVAILGVWLWLNSKVGTWIALVAYTLVVTWQALLTIIILCR